MPNFSKVLLFVLGLSELIGTTLAYSYRLLDMRTAIITIPLNPGVDFIKVGRKAQIIEIALSKLGARRKARRTPVKSFSKLEHRARIGRKKFMKWAPVGHRTIEVVEHPSYCSYLCFNIQANPQIIHANPQITFICNQKHIYLLKFALIFFLFSLLSAFLCQKLKKHISTCIRSNAGRNIQRIFTIYLNANS